MKTGYSAPLSTGRLPPLRGADFIRTVMKSTVSSPLKNSAGEGLARLLVQALIDACGHEVLYLHSTLQLISFYKTFDFVPIPEDQLPRMIRERFLFCFGEMAGCNVCPMRREVGGRCRIRNGNNLN